MEPAHSKLILLTKLKLDAALVVPVYVLAIVLALARVALVPARVAVKALAPVVA